MPKESNTPTAAAPKVSTTQNRETPRTIAVTAYRVYDPQNGKVVQTLTPEEFKKTTIGEGLRVSEVTE